MHPKFPLSVVRSATLISSTFAGQTAQADSAVAWGNNGHGQLGNGSLSQESNSPEPVINLSSGVSAVGCEGDQVSVAIRNGGIYVWGYNGQGQLGTGNTTNSSTPIAITGNLSSGVTAIAGSGNHSLAFGLRRRTRRLPF